MTVRSASYTIASMSAIATSASLNLLASVRSAFDADSRLTRQFDRSYRFANGDVVAVRGDVDPESDASVDVQIYRAADRRTFYLDDFVCVDDIYAVLADVRA